MSRRWIYYVLTVMLGAYNVAFTLNTQFVLTSNQGGWNAGRPWELIWFSWGALCYSACSLGLGGLSDRLGRLPCIAGGLALLTGLSVFFGIEAFGPFTLTQFFIGWGLAQACFAVCFTSIEGLLSDYQDHRVPLARRLGVYCMSWCIGDVLAAWAAGHANQWCGPRPVYQGMAALCVAALVITLWDWRRNGEHRLGEQALGAADIRPGATFHAQLGRIGIFFSYFAYTSVTASFPRFGRDFHRLDKATIGSLIALILFSGWAGFLVIPRWRGWHYHRPLQWLMQLPMLAGLLLMLASPAGRVRWLMVAFVLFGLGWAAAYFFSIYYSLLVPAGHAQSGGIHEAVLGIGNFSGPIVASLVIGWGSARHWLSAERSGLLAIIVAIAGTLVSLAIQGYLMASHKDVDGGTGGLTKPQETLTEPAMEERMAAESR